MSFHVPKDLARDFINNKKEMYKFRYCDLFDYNRWSNDINNIGGVPAFTCCKNLKLTSSSSIF